MYLAGINGGGGESVSSCNKFSWLIYVTEAGGLIHSNVLYFDINPNSVLL